MDKPDSSMNTLVGMVNRMLGKTDQIVFRLAFNVGYAIGKCFDTFAAIAGEKLGISSIRVKKFCSDSVFETSIVKTSFVPPIILADALDGTVRHKIIESHAGDEVFILNQLFKFGKHCYFVGTYSVCIKFFIFDNDGV
jgi:hypothetical protein